MEGFENGTLAITSSELRTIFDETINRVLVLLTNQIHEIAKFGHNKAVPILLVGGFGANLYLRGKIEEEFPANRVIQPPDSYVLLSFYYCLK